MGYIYILRCSDGSYYVGSSANIEKRLVAHKTAKVKYTKSSLPIKLIFVKEFQSYAEAKRFEYKVKSWKKRRSIEKMLSKLDNIVRLFSI